MTTVPVTPVTNLIVGNLPLLNVDVTGVLTLRVVLGAGTVTLTGDVELTLGDIVGLFFNADGFNRDLNASNVVWSMFSLD